MAPRKPEVDRAIQLLEDGVAKSFADAARRVGVTDRAVGNRWHVTHGDRPIPFQEAQREAELAKEEPNAPEERVPTPEERELASRLVESKRTAGAARAEANALRAQVRGLEEERDALQSMLDLAHEVENVPAPDWLGVPKDDGTHRATLVANFSDFHIGEVVDPAEMAGYNAYDAEIAEKRVRRFFERIVLVSRTYLSAVEYDGVVVASLGDTISGDIHDEFRETNELTNFEAAPLAFAWIKEGLGNLADEFGKVHYVGVPGNHPRDSRKPRYKKRSAHNADTMISKFLAKEFENDDRLTFDVPAGISADFQVYGTRFRVEHGDEATGGTGIQGAMLPIALRTHRIRKQAQAEGAPFDVLMMGHWHQIMFMPSKGFIVNGAGKGYDEFARGKGYDPEPPQQSMLVVTPEHGISVPVPLFVSKRSDEGW